MLRVCERVKKGFTLSEAFKDERGLPASFKTMVSLGETSGLLPEALGRISVTSSGRPCHRRVYSRIRSRRWSWLPRAA